MLDLLWSLILMACEHIYLLFLQSSFAYITTHNDERILTRHDYNRRSIYYSLLTACAALTCWTMIDDDFSFLLHRPALSKVLSSSRSSKKFIPLNAIPEQGYFSEPISTWNDGCFWSFTFSSFAFFLSTCDAWTLTCCFLFLSDLFNLRWSMHSSLTL